jgi:hypothetical protein
MDDDSIRNSTHSAENIFKDKYWWLFYIPPGEMEKRVLEMDTVNYKRIGPKRLKVRFGVLECNGFREEKRVECSCVSGKKPLPGRCPACRGRRYSVLFPPIKCSYCHGMGICRVCRGKQKYDRSVTYWYEARTGFLIKQEELLSNGDETIQEIVDIKPKNLLVADRR